MNWLTLVEFRSPRSRRSKTTASVWAWKGPRHWRGRMQSPLPTNRAWRNHGDTSRFFWYVHHGIVAPLHRVPNFLRLLAHLAQVVGPNIPLFLLIRPLWQGYKCPQLPGVYPIYITLASFIILNALLGAGVNIKRVFVDRKRATWEPFKQE